MSGSVVGPISSCESGESNDKRQILVDIGTQFLQRRVIIEPDFDDEKISCLVPPDDVV